MMATANRRCLPPINYKPAINGIGSQLAANARLAAPPGQYGMTIAFDADFDAGPAKASKRLPLVVAVLAVAAMVSIGARGTIVRFVPRTAVLFEALGLPVNLKGLSIERVNARIVADGDRRILVVEGDIVNAGDRAQPAQPLSVTLSGEDGQSLYSWTTRPPQQELSGGDRAAFVARLASPPMNAVGVLVEFDRNGAAPSSAGKAAVKKGAARPLPQGSSTESQYK